MGWRKAIAAWPWFAAALSGFLISLCFPRADQSWLCWLGLTPLIAAAWSSAADRWWKKAGLGYVAGIVFFSLTFKWIGSLAALSASPGLLLLPPLLSLYLGLYFGFWSWLLAALFHGSDFTSSRANLRVAFFAACGWVAQEWVRGWLFSGFGWNGLGVGLHGKIALIQIVEWTGIGGLSFLAVFVNVIAVATVRRFAAEIRRGRSRVHWDFSLTVALVCLVFAFGVRALRKGSPPFTELSVAAIQGNIPQNEKWDEAFETKIYDHYRDLTHFAAELQPQLIIWPEAALPGPLYVEPNYTFVHDLAATGDFSLLLGSLDPDLEGDHQIDYNAAFLLTARGQKTQTYRKNHLVPFGEFIPFRNSFPLFAMIVGNLVPGDIRAGRTQTVLELPQPSVKIAALICFEDTVSTLARHFVLGGAQVLVNITNDGWFMRSEGAEQHLANAVFTAVEMRRPLLRAANTGVTCFVDTYGRVTQSLLATDGTPFVEGVLSGKVAIPTNGPLTFYTRHGEVFSLACFVITVGFLGARIIRQRRAIAS